MHKLIHHKMWKIRLGKDSKELVQIFQLLLSLALVSCHCLSVMDMGWAKVEHREWRLALRLETSLGAEFCPAGLLAASCSCPDLCEGFSNAWKAQRSCSWLLLVCILFSKWLVKETKNLPCEIPRTKHLTGSCKHLVREKFRLEWILISLQTTNKMLKCLSRVVTLLQFEIILQVSAGKRGWGKM